jgi:hypothetical protein
MPPIQAYTLRDQVRITSLISLVLVFHFCVVILGISTAVTPENQIQLLRDIQGTYSYLIPKLGAQCGR